MKFVNSSPWQLAMRELQQTLRLRSIWVGATAAGLVLGLAAPFETQEHLRLFPRLIYWTAVIQVTFGTGIIISTLLRERLKPYGAAGTLSGSLCVGLAVTAEVLGLNWIVFDCPPHDLAYALPLSVNTMVISIIATCAIGWLQGELSKPAPDLQQQHKSPVQTPPLLARLSPDKRATILSLTMQDHYVEVTTSKGAELLLMRLRDAIPEAGDGFQIHRSHWVAKAAIAQVIRTGATARITTTDGRNLPVSRSQIATLKENGLLP